MVMPVIIHLVLLSVMISLNKKRMHFKHFLFIKSDLIIHTYYSKIYHSTNSNFRSGLKKQDTNKFKCFFFFLWLVGKIIQEDQIFL